ncbi:hypothetical protein ABTW96_08675 [Nocardia beijingensis]
MLDLLVAVLTLSLEAASTGDTNPTAVTARLVSHVLRAILGL